MVSKCKISLDKQVSNRQSRTNKGEISYKEPSDEELSDEELSDDELPDDELPDAELPDDELSVDELSEDKHTSEFGKRMEQNMKENANFLSQLGILKAKQEILDSTKKLQAVKRLKASERKSEPNENRTRILTSGRSEPNPLRAKSKRLQNCSTKPIYVDEAAADNDQIAPWSPCAWVLYCEDHRKRFVEENPDKSFGLVMVLLGASWKSLAKDERDIYEEKAKELALEAVRATAKEDRRRDRKIEKRKQRKEK